MPALSDYHSLQCDAMSELHVAPITTTYDIMNLS